MEVDPPAVYDAHAVCDAHDVHAVAPTNVPQPPAPFSPHTEPGHPMVQVSNPAASTRNISAAAEGRAAESGAAAKSSSSAAVEGGAAGSGAAGAARKRPPSPQARYAFYGP